MRKQYQIYIIGIAIYTIFPVYAQQIDPQGIINRLHDQGMTIYTTVDQYRPEDSMTRGETSKMISKYAESLNLQADYTGSCVFDDIADYDYTLQPTIASSCKYGLLKGSQGSFYPNQTLTQAQALVLIQRAKNGFENESGEPWYREYFKGAVQLGLVQQDQIATVAQTPISRMELASRLYTASRDITTSDDTGQPQTTYIPQGAVALPPIVIRGQETTTTPSTPIIKTTTQSNTNTSTPTRTSRDETKIGGSYTWSYNYDTYQPWSEATVQLELAAGKRVVLFFGSQSSLQSRVLDNNIKEGVRGNISIIFIDFDTATTLRSQYGVTNTHTLLYLDSNGNVTYRTTNQDVSVGQIVDNFDGKGTSGQKI